LGFQVPFSFTINPPLNILHFRCKFTPLASSNRSSTKVQPSLRLDPASSINIRPRPLQRSLDLHHLVAELQLVSKVGFHPLPSIQFVFFVLCFRCFGQIVPVQRVSFESVLFFLLCLFPLSEIYENLCADTSI